MEARIFSAAIIAASILSLGASYRTQNFVVQAATPELAREIGEAGEAYRRDLAIEWLGKELPPWQQPCPIRAEVSPHLGAGGATSFMFDRGRPFGWRMNIQGSRERVLDSVLPHEITHTIFATHFGRPLPRWADEGACTTVEHDVEKQRQHKMLYTFLTTGRGIAFNDMFAMKEYPADIMPLYSQGYSLARFLIAQGGKQKYVNYVGDGMDWNNWTAATKKHYGFESLSELQITWLEWVRRGCPPLPEGHDATGKNTLLVSNDANEATSDTANDSFVRAATFATEEQTGADGVSTIMASSSASDAAGDGFTTPASSGGWYARQRDLAKQSQVGENSNPAMESSESVLEQSVTRPQKIGRPSQIIIEPSGSQLRHAPANGNMLVPVPLDASSHDSRSRFQRILR